MGLRSRAMAAAVVVAFAPAYAFAESLNDVLTFNIPAQSLDSALLEFSRQSGVQVISQAGLLTGVAAAPVQARTSGREALILLLRPSNLAFEITGDHTVSIVRRGAIEPVSKPPVGRRDDVLQGGALVSAAVGPIAPAVVQEVVVTGSRLQVLGFQAPTPVTIVTAEQLNSQALGTVAEAISLLPSMRFSGPQDTRSGTQGGSGGAYLNMRGLTPVRTLTLLDGRRVVGGTASGSVDANMLPTALLERVDVVTGGASAAYGSDAVAGVVNFILKKRFQGLLGEVQTGASTYGDNGEVKLAMAYGRPLGEGRGHLLASAEAYQSDGVDCRCSRPIERDSWNIILNPNYTPSNGQPRRILVADVRSTQSAYGGLIAGGPFAGLTFDPDGSSRPFVYGSLVSGPAMVGGEGPRGADFTVQSAAHRRASAFVRGSWALSDRVSVYAEGLYSFTRIYFGNVSSDSIGASALTIRSDNPYLPASLAAAMAAQGVGSFRLARTYSDLPAKDTFQRTWTQRYVAGANIELGPAWKADVYAQHGIARNSARVPHNLNLLNLYLAQDAVTNAAGQIVCRSTLTSPGNGCVPFNALGSGRASLAAEKYVLGESNGLAIVQQDVAAASLNGQPFRTRAGPVAVALGVEYRSEGFDQTSDPVSQAINPFTGFVGAWRNANPQPQFGELQVTEAFAEANVPLAVRIPLADELNLNAALRTTEYSTSGSVTSWKLGLQWKPVSELRFRVTRSRDIRAPNINELFLGGNQQFAVIVDPFRNTTVGSIRQTTRGNPDLTPELASTIALGVIYQPSDLSGFNLSVDLYNIDIHDAIASATPQQTMDQCYAGAAESCRAILRDASGTLVAIDVYPRNLSGLKTRGVDFEAAFSVAPESLPAGALSFNVRGTYVDRLEEFNPGAQPIDRAGDVRTGSQPRWRWNGQADYSLGAVTVNLQGRWVGGGRLDSGVPRTDIDVFEVKGRLYVDARLGWRLRDGAELYASAANLFNTTPPIPPNSTVYDSVGRMLRVGVRLGRL